MKAEEIAVLLSSAVAADSCSERSGLDWLDIGVALSPHLMLLIVDSVCLWCWCVLASPHSC